MFIFNKKRAKLQKNQETNKKITIKLEINVYLFARLKKK